MFVKAVGPEPNPDSPGAHRAEARNMGLLPRSAPADPPCSGRSTGTAGRRWPPRTSTAPTRPAVAAGQLHRLLEMVATMAAAHAAGADPLAVTTALAAFAGFLLGGARLPDPPGLPTLRAFQLGQGLVALDWLRRRTGWT